jgi:rubrerythrin
MMASFRRRIERARELAGGTSAAAVYCLACGHYAYTISASGVCGNCLDRKQEPALKLRTA